MSLNFLMHFGACVCVRVHNRTRKSDKKKKGVLLGIRAADADRGAALGRPAGGGTALNLTFPRWSPSFQSPRQMSPTTTAPPSMVRPIIP